MAICLPNTQILSLSTGAADTSATFVSRNFGDKKKNLNLLNWSDNFLQHCILWENKNNSKLPRTPNVWRKKVCSKQRHSHQHPSQGCRLSLALYDSCHLRQNLLLSLAPYTSNHRTPSCVDQSQPTGQLWYSNCQPEFSTQSSVCSLDDRESVKPGLNLASIAGNATVQRSGAEAFPDLTEAAGTCTCFLPIHQDSKRSLTVWLQKIT